MSADGALLAPTYADSVAYPVDWWHAQWEPELRLVNVDSPRADWWRKREPRIPRGGRLREGCLRAGEPLYVEGCLVEGRDAPTIGACHDIPLVVTPGDGTSQPRVDARAAWFAGRIPLLGVALLVLLAYLWHVTRARPFTDVLLQRLEGARRVTLGKGALWVIALSPLASLLMLYAYQEMRGGPATVPRLGYALPHAAVALAVVLGVLMLDRRRALGALMDALRDTETPPLGDAREGQLVAVDAEVSPDAPSVTARLTGRGCAHHGVQVTFVYKSDQELKSMRCYDQADPLLVPIQAGGAAAILDLSSAVVDLRGSRKVVGHWGLRRGRYAHILGPPKQCPGVYVIEERRLEAGEPIYVSGWVKRLTEARADPGYRSVSVTPVLAGSPTSPLVVHAGSRRTLLRGLSVERTFLSAALGVLAAVVTATAALFGYLVHL